MSSAVVTCALEQNYLMIFLDTFLASTGTPAGTKKKQQRLKAKVLPQSVFPAPGEI